MKIEFVSDVACPWCAIGLAALEQALATLGDTVAVELSFEPFELCPDMGAAGEDTVAYLSAKYGRTPAQIAETQAAIRARGAELGFDFGPRSRVWNTFDAHRLLHWAGTVDPARQRALKHALLRAYHGQGRNTSDPQVLLELTAASGLDEDRAREILAGDTFAAEVRARERFWQDAGIHSVPAVVIDRQHLISGGQPPQVFADALRRIAAGG
ncbi:MAG: DsbA family oxidoreductase [Rubrivivax sp.]|nr:DsbA family oxidoreductase [Rubrivivax sp.]